MLPAKQRETEASGVVLTGKAALVEWCRQQTSGYRDVNVRDLTHSWRDGMALCAIIHRFRPDLINFEQLCKDDHAKNNGLAFSIAERELGIPALLDVCDVTDLKVPDEKSMATYISLFYQRFKDHQPNNKVEPRKKKRYMLDIFCDDATRKRLFKNSPRFCDVAE